MHLRIGFGLHKLLWPPVRPAQNAHDGRHQHASHDKCVHEDGQHQKERCTNKRVGDRKANIQRHSGRRHGVKRSRWRWGEKGVELLFAGNICT